MAQGQEGREMKRVPCKHRVWLRTTGADGTPSARTVACCDRKTGFLLKHLRCDTDCRRRTADWLRAHGFTHLHLPGDEPCKCQLDDLRPCGKVSAECVPGVLGADGLMYADKKAAAAAKKENCDG
jgi:hypothetical protein